MVEPQRNTVPPAHVSPAQQQKSLGELFSDLSHDTSLLIRQEIELATAEIQQKIDTATQHIIMIVAGGAVAYFGAFALLAALILILGQVIDMWLSALVVGIIFAALGGFMVYRAVNRLKEINPKPEKTVQTLEEDKRWVQNQLT